MRNGFAAAAARDLAFSLRMIRRNPGYAIVVVLTLALGIGANTAIFSVVDGVLLAPLPYASPDRLVIVMESNPRFAQVAISYPNFQDWQREAHSFDRMAAVRWQGYDLTGAGAPEHLNGAEITSGFFATLGVRPALGREFAAKEDNGGGAPEAVLSYALWTQRFGGNPDVLGKPLNLSGVEYTIVGVSPRGFRFFDDAQVFTPLEHADPLVIHDRASHDNMFCVARLKSGVTLAAAQAEMRTLQANLDRQYPEADRDIGTDIVAMQSEIVGSTRPTLLLLLGAVGLVLLIACANVANLQLARAMARTREFAVRSALGAGRARLVRQLLTESLLLALAGGALGVFLAKFGVRLALAIAPGLPRTDSIGLNLPVLAFSLGISVAVGLLFGLVPGLRMSRVDVESALRSGSRGATVARPRLLSMLVVVQVALAAILLVASGLLLRAIRDIWSSNPGFDVDHVLTFRVGLAHGRATSAGAIRAQYQQLLDRIRSVPGVQAADFTWLVPLSGADADMPFWIGAQKPASLQAAPRLLLFATGTDYLKAMGIPLLRGRFFSSSDTTQSPCVVAIDSEFAHRYFAHSNPVGQTISFGFNPVGPCRIVGIVAHVRHWRIGAPANFTQSEAYFPLTQDPDRWVAANYADSTIVVRTSLSVSAVLPALRRAEYGTGPGQPIYDVRTMHDIVSESMAAQRLPLMLLTAFAALALALASVGIYGVMAYCVSERRREIGIRMALGAECPQISSMILGHGLQLAASGLAIGAVAALLLSHAMASFSSLLYGVSADDPLTYVAVAGILIGVAAVACIVPARRALAVDPVIALRCE